MRESKAGRTAIRGHFAEMLAAKPTAQQSFPHVDKAEYSDTSKRIPALFVANREWKYVCVSRRSSGSVIGWALIDWLNKNKGRWSCNSNVTADNRARGRDLSQDDRTFSSPGHHTVHSLIIVIISKRSHRKENTAWTRVSLKIAKP